MDRDQQPSITNREHIQKFWFTTSIGGPRWNIAVCLLPARAAIHSRWPIPARGRCRRALRAYLPGGRIRLARCAQSCSLLQGLEQRRFLTRAKCPRGRWANRGGGGGAKGIDIDSSMNILVSASECQPLAFFDFRKILDQLNSRGSPREFWADTSELELNYE